MRCVGFLHTSPVHVATFDRLVAEADPTVETVTVVDEAVLADARAHGPDAPAVVAAIDRALDRLVDAGATSIVCTCSTIADRAEIEGRRRSIDVRRVDRPMAELAVATGERITVIAALASTVEPTTRLLADVAATAGVSVEVTVRICEGAWGRFERGDLDGYARSVAATCDAATETSDVIVLAQASMAPAVALCTTPVPVLSSPGLAVAAVLATLG